MAGRVWMPGDPWDEWRPVPGRTPLKSVHACERESWSLLSWPKGAVDLETGELKVNAEARPGVRPFLCGSWRCRRCARIRGASDFVRAREAILKRSWWVYVVLTFDPAGYRDPWSAYNAAGTCWDRHLRQSLRRRGGKLEYFQTVEAHRSGWPHVNLMLSGADLRAWVEELGVVQREITTPQGRTRIALLPRRWRKRLRSAAMRAGFGKVCWAEVVSPERSESMAGYLLKLARELTGGVGGKKGEQSPIGAPKGFRRIRASRGLLPPCKLRGDGNGPNTGALGLFRSALEPSPAREAGQKVRSLPGQWSDVFASLEADARRRAAIWAEQHSEQLERPDEIEELDIWPTADAPLELR
jgi:hypothetical protein